MTPKLYTTAEAAKMRGVSVRRIQAEIKQGHFPNAKKFGRDWLIPHIDLDVRKSRSSK